MTLKPKNIPSAVFTITALIVLSFSSFAQNKPVVLPAPASQTEEEKKAGKELEKKALALLDELVVESASLKQPENRIYVQMKAAESLWKYDEARAQALIHEAMNQVIALMRESQEAAAREGEQYTASPPRPRRDNSHLQVMLLNVLAQRDPRMALEFLRSTKALQPADWRRPGEHDQHRALELQLAGQIAEKDPHLALQIAEEHLGKKLDYQLFNVWDALQRKDPKAASKLTGEIIGQLKAQNLLGSHDNLHLAFNVLQRLKSRVNEIENAQKNPAISSAPPANSAEIQQAYREILEFVVAAALKVTANNMLDPQEADRARNAFAQMRHYLPEVEKHLPARAAPLRAKLAQFNQAAYNDPYRKFQEEYGARLRSMSPQEILAVAAQSPDQARDMIIYQAAQRAVEQGDAEMARKIARENIRDKQQARNFLASLERREADRAVGEGKFNDARRLLAGMRTAEERAGLLVWWATAAAGKGDGQTARQFFEEARGLLGDRMQTQTQLNAQVSLANAAINLEPEISFGIAEATIERLNRVIAATAEMMTFEGTSDGELGIIAGGNWGHYSGMLTPFMSQLARKDFDRAVALIKRWQPDEVRLAMTLTLVENLLRGQDGMMRHRRGELVPLRPGIR